VAGVTTGLQLFYVLPCFPPYAPGTLDQRLAGLATGGLLLVVADRLLWSAPAPAPFGERLAAAADRVAAHAGALRTVLEDPRAGTDAERTARRAAWDAAVGLRLTEIPFGQRPLGPGLRDRALLAGAGATRTAAGRLSALADFAGTAAGAVLAAGLLLLVGPDVGVYAGMLPLLMVLALTAGSVFGTAAGQAGFTVVVAVLFAQLAPADWRLAEVRLTDVVIGGLVGAVIGAAAWPRGGGGEVRRAAAEGLRAGAAAVRDTVAGLATGRPPAANGLHRWTGLLDHAYAQFRTEPGGAPGPDWLVVLAVLHRLDDDVAVLRDRHPAGPPPPAEAADPLVAVAAEVAAAYTGAADALGAGRPPAAGAGAVLRRRLDAADAPALPDDREAALRLLDAWGWLHALTDDLDLLERADATGPAS
jgi:hypothetical protein